jgi:hypothetical protein
MPPTKFPVTTLSAPRAMSRMPKPRPVIVKYVGRV